MESSHPSSSVTHHPCNTFGDTAWCLYPRRGASPTAVCSHFRRTHTLRHTAMCDSACTFTAQLAKTCRTCLYCTVLYYLTPSALLTVKDELSRASGQVGRRLAKSVLWTRCEHLVSLTVSAENLRFKRFTISTQRAEDRLLEDILSHGCIDVATPCQGAEPLPRGGCSVLQCLGSWTSCSLSWLRQQPGG